MQMQVDISSTEDTGSFTSLEEQNVMSAASLNWPRLSKWLLFFTDLKQIILPFYVYPNSKKIHEGVRVRIGKTRVLFLDCLTE